MIFYLRKCIVCEKRLQMKMLRCMNIVQRVREEKYQGISINWQIKFKQFYK